MNCATNSDGWNLPHQGLSPKGLRKNRLPPSVRRQMALRLLESVESDEAEAAAETWLHTAAAEAYDALKSDPSRAIPAEDVRAQFEAKWAARS